MKSKHSQRVLELCIFSMLGAVMFCSKLVMELLPNIHILGMLIMAYTVAFGIKALIPIYVFVALTGVYAGFAPWWVPYLYIWSILSLVTLLIPRNIPRRIAAIVYPIVCALHGLAYGVLYAPAQALLYGFNFEQTVAWIIAGFPFDVIHGISNFVAGMLVYPLSALLKMLMTRAGK